MSTSFYGNIFARVFYFLFGCAITHYVWLFIYYKKGWGRQNFKFKEYPIYTMPGLADTTPPLS